MRPHRRPGAATYPPGEPALRAALRRWRRPSRPPAGDGGRRWRPRLTPEQTRALVGAALTLAAALGEYLRGRWER
jgi:hypothetical protein